MGLFQALLLAASLGWTAVLADPSASATASSPATSTWTFTGFHRPTLKNLSPVLQSSASHLSEPGYSTTVQGSMTANAPITMQTATSLDSPPTYASPVTMVTGTSLDQPGGPTSKLRMPVTQPTAASLEVPGHAVSRVGSPTAGGGSSPNEGGSPAPQDAAETYYIHGSAVVAGASATVIAGTTYSIAKSGARIWVDGTATSAEGVVSTAAALGSAGGSTPAAATGGAVGGIVPPGIAMGVALGLIALM